MKLRDFQISVAGRRDIDEMRAFHHRLFPIYEAVRLWLRPQKLDLPFGKVSIVLLPGEGPPTVALAIDVLNVGISLDWDDFSSRVATRAGLISTLASLIAEAERDPAWTAPHVSNFVAALEQKTPMISHVFEKTKRVIAGVECQARFEADLGSSKIVVEFRSPKGVIDEVVLEKDGPLWLEDDFPVTSARIVDGAYLLISREGGLATLQVPHQMKR